MPLTDEDDAFQSNIPVSLDITVAVVYFVFGICSLFGNTTLLYVSYKKKHLLKPAECFIINLAISDLGLTVSLYPLAITSSIYHRWLYGKTVCSVYAFCGMLFGICSLTTLTLLSMVCFLKVCYPHYGNRFSYAHSRLLIACAWIYALLFACSPLAHWGEYGPEPYGTACCIDWHLSNEHTMARSYTLVLFIFCFILPCCVIVASYTGILVTVQASRKTMEQHASRQTQMSSIQAIIVKISVAVCIGFFTAWSPYAVVSMWATFGPINNIHPMAFALPAMFAKSSTIYNPIIYLMLRPNIRRMIRRDLCTLCHVCVRSCFCSQPLGTCCSKPEIRVRLHTIPKQNNQLPSSHSAPQLSVVSSKSYSDEMKNICDVRESRECGVLETTAGTESCKDPVTAVQQTHNNQGSVSVCHKKSSVSLEMVPGRAKVAWP